LLATQVVLAVEIISPGSARTDRIAKLADYAEAGIENYLIVDISGTITMDVFALAGDHYETAGRFEGGLAHLVSPISLTLDLDTLVVR
jgi:Uma2 family endonuclease